MQLPPLNALRAFEAAARLGSLAAAASDLNVSPGAVSRHVKLLEAHLGVPLFERLPQGVRITDAGARLATELTAAFDSIAAATRACRRMPATLRLIASPTFANRCLIPRLRDFTDAHPEIDVTVGVLLTDLSEITRGGHDCGIVTVHGRTWPEGWTAVRVSGEALIPVCAPALLAAHAAPYHPTLLADLPLLAVANCPQDWPMWLAANDISGTFAPRGGTALETGEMAIRAAVEGLGVIIMDRHLIREELAEGRLVEVFPGFLPVENGYHFICEARRHNEPAISAFRDWVLATFGGAG